MESGNGELKGLLTAKEEGLISGKFLFDHKMVLYSKIRPYLMKVARPEFGGLCSADVYPLEPTKTLISRDFLYHLLFTKSFTEFAIEGSARAGMPKVNRDHLFAFEFRLPPLTEQQRIVAILDEAFEGIATATANAERNLQSAWDLLDGYMESLFTRGTTGTVVRPLGEIASFRNGVNFTKQSKGQSVPIIGVKDFKKNFWAPMDDLDSVTMDGQLSAIDAVQVGDILSVRSNGNPVLIGRCILVPEHEGNVTHSGFTIRVRLEMTAALPQYVCHYLKSQTARRELVAGGTGTNIKSLNQGTLASILIPLPPLAKQETVIQSIEAMADEAEQLKSVYQQKLAALDEMKQSLLHRAFNGDL
jgi:type I restriction enzyme S subunit